MSSREPGELHPFLERHGVGIVLAYVGYIVFYFGFTIGALPVLGYQSYFYLKSGQWFPLSAIDGLKYLLGLRLVLSGAAKEATPEQMHAIKAYIWPWLWHPQDWVGIHEILESTPLSLFFGLIIGLGLLLISLFIYMRN